MIKRDCGDSLFDSSLYYLIWKVPSVALLTRRTGPTRNPGTAQEGQIQQCVARRGNLTRAGRRTAVRVLW